MFTNSFMIILCFYNIPMELRKIIDIQQNFPQFHTLGNWRNFVVVMSQRFIIEEKILCVCLKFSFSISCNSR